MDIGGGTLDRIRGEEFIGDGDSVWNMATVRGRSCLVDAVSVPESRRTSGGPSDERVA